MQVQQPFSITDTLNQRVVWRISLAHLVLAAIVAASAALHFSNLEAIGDANSYYTAAVEAMLQSWHNFFFAAAEPGGSVTVDKPPLGLWIQAASAYVFGVNGFAVVLPSILAGLASIVVVYHLVRRWFGPAAALLAALATALAPVAFAADRNNTADSILTLFLLLAAWAFIQATESGKLRYLLLGGLMIGLAFNIKMLQAYLVLPALYALYVFVAKEGWSRKLLNLGITTALLVAVSLSWALVVDAVPADQRPYIGSSSDNTVMELIIGHNGLNRLFGGGGGAAAAQLSPDAGDDAGAGLQPPANGPQGGPATGGPGFAGPRGDQGPAGGGGAFSSETGEAGLTRFFEAPLAKEMSWLLPFALLGLGLALFAAPLRLPVSSRAHMAALLWGGWLLTCLVFFSLASFFHAYYMVMLVPALGSLVGIGGTLLWRLAQRRLLAAGLLLVTSTVTVLFQLYLANALGVAAAWLWLPWLLLAGALALFFTALLPEVDWRRWALPAFALALAAMLVAPATWSWLTVFEDNNANLPAAYSGENALAQGRPNLGGERNAVNEELLDYLQANTEGMTYLMAVESSMQGASYVIETGRGVLYMGGFNGGDPVVDAADLAALVAGGELRYVMSGGGRRGGLQGVSQWLASACTPLPEYSQLPQANLGDDGGPPDQVNRGTILYDCGN